MSGLNSIVGLNKVSVDYRPEIVSTEKNEGKKDVDNIAKDVDNTVKNVDNIESGVDNVQNDVENIINIDPQEQLAGKGVRAGVKGDPRVKEMLNAKFLDLMPREAIMMHGTADSIEIMHKALQALSWAVLVSNKETATGVTTYTLYVDIVDASLKYAKTLVITAKVGPNGVKATAAFAK